MPPQETRNRPGCAPLDDDANPVTETDPYDPACRDDEDC